jgi:hypothetical protein
VRVTRGRIVRHGVPETLCERLDADEVVLGERRFVVRRGSDEALEETWLAAARLDEHAVRVARPAAWVRGVAAAFELPLDAGPERASRAKSARAELEALLADRGLAVPELEACELRRAADGRVWLVAPADVRRQAAATRRR